MEERLQKLIAQAGVASRRAAEELIKNGEVLVNGNIATLGTKADPEKDHIKVRGKLINARLEKYEKIYLLLNKPVGYITTKSDPEGRKLVTELVGKYRDKVHPVGRLDVNSEGLLLLTNDGQFTQAVAHAAGKVAKIYQVKVKGQPSERQIRQIARGVELDGVKTAPAEIRQIELSDTNAWYEVTLYEGRNQQIRKMFKSIGHSVLKLKRVAIGFLKHERLATGEMRELTEAEVKRFLRMKETAPALPPLKAEKQRVRKNKRPAKRMGTTGKTNV
jgi:23S rRNA pseudouridine2605 synthase